MEDGFWLSCCLDGVILGASRQANQDLNIDLIYTKGRQA